MPEPTSTTAVTLAAASAAVPVLTAFGVPLGLRPELLIAGFAGSLVAITLLNTVPAKGEGWAEFGRATVRRIGVALASSLTAGYVTPLVLLIPNVPEPILFGSAFVVGGGAQHILASLIRRFSSNAAGGS